MSDVNAMIMLLSSNVYHSSHVKNIMCFGLKKKKKK